MSQSRAGFWLLLALAACLAVASTGCASATGAVRVVHVSERDFHIVVPKQVRAGKVRFEVDNHGPDTHELIVVRAEGGARLPLRPDGLTVDEDALRARTVLTLEGTPRNGTREHVVVLRPGRYILFCNMAGHYLGGMHATLVAR